MNDRVASLRSRVSVAVGRAPLGLLGERIDRLEVGYAEERALLDGLERQVGELEQALARAYGVAQSIAADATDT